MSELIGRIVKILSPYAVVINLGSKDGVQLDDEFIIYAEGDMIKDPDTNEDLEHIEIVKARVRVTHVQEKISTAQAIKRRELTTLASSLFNPLGSRQIAETIEEKVKVTDADFDLLKSSPVKEGDYVRRT